MNEVDFHKLVNEKTLLMMSGDRAAAEKWLRTPRPEFGFNNALQMVEVGRGEEVEALIGRIMHGVFS
jgi:hypothetical protein